MNRFRKAYIRFYPGLVSYALKIIKSQDAAEDIVQEVFLKLWNDGEIKEIRQLDNYLLYVVKNRCIDYLRKQKHQKTVYLETLDNSGDNLNARSDNSVPEEKEIELITRLYLEINKLPPKCREVFMLVKFHGYTYQQAADYHKISINMVKKQVGKALRQLRRNLIP